MQKLVTMHRSFDLNCMFKTTLFLVLCGFATFAQKSFTLKKNQVGYLRKDVGELTLDTLVMKDSSTLIFSGRKNMYLLVNHLVIGKGCTLEGAGANGRNGDILGPTGTYTNNIYTPAVTRGDGGWSGRPGTDLFITIKDLIAEDNLTISVPGGNGGDGTEVPVLQVFSSRPGVNTINYNANNPYNGLPGRGGNGGRGGNVAIAYPPEVADRLGRIVVVNYGGLAGNMGSFNPMNVILPPFSFLNQRAPANGSKYSSKNSWEGVSGKVKLMKLKSSDN